LNPHLLHIDLYELASLGIIFTGLNFALLLWFTRRSNQAANRFLALAICCVVSWLVWLLCTDMRPDSRFPFLLALGPLIYFYVLKITYPEFKIRLKDLLHFGPLLLALGFRVLPGAAVVSVSIYLLLSHRLIAHFYARLEFTGGDRYRQELRWLQHLISGFGVGWLLWIPFTVAADYYHLGTPVYQPLYLLTGAMTIWMAATAFSRPEARIPAAAPSFLKPALPADLKRKGAWLKKVMQTNFYYRDMELSLGSLAEKLDLNPHELSRIVNTVLKKSFNDFINEYRVADVIRRMQDPANDHLTLLGIAYESGFNSKTSFNRIFKQMTGKNPEDYKAELKKQAPSYNLGLQRSPAAVISFQQTMPHWSAEKLNRNTMFKNYLKTAWRSLRRHQSFTAINITGLTVGIAACLLIFLVVRYETSFDTFHAKKDNIYRLTGVVTKPSLGFQTGVPFPLPEALRLDFPQLPGIASILRNEGSLFSVDHKKFKEDETYYADPAFFETFDFPWLAGNKTSLAEPNTVVLTRSEAGKFFGDWHQAMGKTIRYKNSANLKVSGILEDVPPNTDFPLKIVISYASMQVKGAENFSNRQNWGLVLGENYCFVVLPKGAIVSTYEKQLDAFTQRHNPGAYKAGQRTQLQPLTAMHYDTRLDIFTGHPFSKQLLNAISLIGLFLLLIACVNFINLATAQAVNRSKEVGIRKVLGSRRKQLVLQFMSETGIITLCAILLALVLSWLALSPVNRLLDIRLNAALILEPITLAFLGLLWLAVTFLSGFYPAMVLSGFNPISALKNKFTSVSPGGISLRRALVVMQFCIAQLLIIGILVMISQLNYFKNKSPGFDKTAVITLPLPNDSLSKTKLAFFQNELQQQPGVKALSYSSYSPVDEDGWLSGIHFERAQKETDFTVNLKWADAGHFKLYQFAFLAGRPYAASDTLSGYVVNETLVKKLGLASPQQAIGKTIGLWNNRHFTAPIVGVVRDYNVGSLKDAVPPVLMANQKSLYGTLNIKIRQADIRETLSGIERSYNKAFPDALYEYHFIDEQIAHFYKTETRLSQLYQVFAGIAIFISCLGLFGLVSFMAVQRTKEVGIRKTLGASAGHIVYLFSKEFTLLVLVAFAISAPVGWYLMHKWLESYVFRIRLGPGIFLLAMLLSVVIAWLTVGYKALKAALANPVSSLRSE
jgi:putative ABC transport system permease protein